MDVTFESIDKENSQVLLKIKVKKDEIKKEYDVLIKDAQKKAEIKGFRKGMVPISILETKYKEGFLAETANKVIDKALTEVLEKAEKQPIAYSMPKLENFKLPELAKDYSFEIVYDTFPSYTVSNFKTVEVNKDEVKISDSDIESELERLTKEFTTIEPKDGKIEDKDIVIINYTVFDGQKEIEKKENQYIYMDKDIDTYKLSQDIVGMKKGEEKEFEKSFTEKDSKNLAGEKFQIKLKINEIKQEVKPKLTDDLANQINENCKTVKELREEIKNNLIKFSDDTLKQKTINKILDKLTETFKGDIPESMINQQQEMFYKEFVNRVGGDEKKAESLLKMDNLTKETYKEKVKDDSLKEIKIGLIIQKISTDEQITATDEDIQKFVEPIAKQYKITTEEFISKYKQAQQFELIKNQIESKKVLDHIYENAKIKKGKKINFTDLFNQQE